MRAIDKFVIQLQEEIGNQTVLLNTYVELRNWNGANNQQEYLKGLSSALILAQAIAVMEREQ